MRHRDVLMVDADGLTAYRCRGGEVVAIGRFPRSRISDFDAQVRAHSDTDYMMLADVTDESFELECIPHVRGRSREAMMARKRERHSHGSPLCIALPHGRQADGRRDDCFLFAALTPARSIDPWLRILEQAEASFVGLYSLPQVLSQVAGRTSANAFVLASVAHSGLRQTFIVDGRLRFSRLTALPGDTMEEAAAACVAEAANLRRYLSAQRLVERDVCLPVLVLAHPIQVECFRRHCHDTEELHFDYLDLAAEARQRGLATEISDSYGNALFVHMLVSTPPRQQFAPPTSLRHWRLSRMRFAVDAFGLAALALALVFAAAQLPGLVTSRDTRPQAADTSESFTWQTAPQPSFAVPARDLLTLDAGYESLLHASAGPAPLFVRLSRALDDLPAIELDSIEWQALEGRGADAASVLEVSGRIAPGADPRDVEKMAEQLRRDPALQADILKYPLAVASDQTISSADLSRNDGSFIVRVAEKP